MFSAIDSTHDKILEKLTIIRRVAVELNTYTDTTCLVDHIDETDARYNLSVANLLGVYCNGKKVTKDYYRVISSENICGELNELIWQLHDIISKQTNSSAIDIIKIDCDIADKIKINEYLEKEEDELCKCGSPLQLVSEVAELRCNDCNFTKSVIGGVFKEEQFGSKERAKNVGSEVVRHLKFWLDRIQAIEPKSFNPKIIAKIKKVMNRKGIIRTELSCELMRRILKDSEVASTNLNDHVPLLIKTLGGREPPTFTYTETQVIQLRFIRAANIYEQLYSGNKPYYPHFIYKIIEEMFKNDKSKLRILNYIHLQSIETIEKNDRAYKNICNIVDDPDSGLVYKDTNIFRVY